MALVIDKEEKKKSIAVCPKCNSNNLVIREYWHNYIEFIQDDGVIDMLGNLDSDAPYKLRGLCQQCGHGWTVKNKQKITQLCVG